MTKAEAEVEAGVEAEFSGCAVRESTKKQPALFFFDLRRSSDTPSFGHEGRTEPPQDAKSRSDRIKVLRENEE